MGMHLKNCIFKDPPTTLWIGTLIGKRWHLRFKLLVKWPPVDFNAQFVQCTRICRFLPNDFTHKKSVSAKLNEIKEMKIEFITHKGLILREKFNGIRANPGYLENEENKAKKSKYHSRFVADRSS